MNELKVFEKNGQLLTDSREVAKMIDRPHYDLMKAIRSYCDYLNEGNFPLVDFFLESTYPDGKGEIRPCYLLTKKGCDMVANKLTGQKGVLFTAAYVTAFEQMREHIKTGKALPDDESRKLRARAMALNAANRSARMLSTLLAIADALHVPLAELFDEPQSVQPDLPQKQYDALAWAYVKIAERCIA